MNIEKIRKEIETASYLLSDNDLGELAVKYYVDLSLSVEGDPEQFLSLFPRAVRDDIETAGDKLIFYNNNMFELKKGRPHA